MSHANFCAWDVVNQVKHAQSLESKILTLNDMA